MDTTLADPLVGRVLDGRYAVEERLARGGMATVYRATDLRLDRVVAVKVMHPALADDAEFVARFNREARAAARLSHPNVVAVFDQGSDAGAVFLVMEYVDGVTVRDMLRAHGRLAPGEALQILRPVLAALGAAHAAGLVHRDIKPENVLLSRTGEVKVADFGLARAVQGATLTATAGLLMGTVAYLAPEQVERGGADPRSDVYAAGIVLFELLTGVPPYAGETPLSVAYRHVHDDVPEPSALVDGIPASVDDLVVSATRRDAARRPVDAGAFLAELRLAARDVAPATLDLARWVADLAPAEQPTVHSTRVVGDTGVTRRDPRPPGAPPTYRPPGAHPAARPAPRRRRRWPWLVLLLLLSAAAVGGGVYAAGLIHRVHYVMAPKVVKQPEKAAVATLTAHGLRPTVHRAYSRTVGDGLVISESPVGRVPEKTVVTLVVSRGPAPATVPDVSDEDVASARAALTKAGLVVAADSRHAYSETVTAGNVIATDPKAGEHAHDGDPVTIIVSRGQQPIDVPDVAGSSLQSAEAALKHAGFTIGHVDKQFSDTVGKGDVIATDPAAGATKHRGDSISIVESKGPDVVTVPDVVHMRVSAAEARLRAAGLQYRIDTVLGGLLGRVALQGPNAGNVVKRGTVVTLVVQ